MRLRELVEDEKSHLSTGRVGMWSAVLLAYVAVGVDLWLTLHAVPRHVPETAYGVLGTMFMAFAAMSGVPRAMEYLGPQIGAVAAGLSQKGYQPNEWAQGDPHAGVL